MVLACQIAEIAFVVLCFAASVIVFFGIEKEIKNLRKRVKNLEKRFDDVCVRWCNETEESLDEIDKLKKMQKKKDAKIKNLEHAKKQLAKGGKKVND